MRGLRRATTDSSEALEARIQHVLEDLAPLLHIDRCLLRVSRFDMKTGHLAISIAGSCPDCAGSPAMFSTAIEAHVRQRVSEVRRVLIES
jgi:Fe-S cluster biogenesis protein NfuA